MILSNAQVSTLQKVLGACNQVLPRIEMLEQLGDVSPALKDRAAELRARREYLVTLATSALELNRQVAKA